MSRRSRITAAFAAAVLLATACGDGDDADTTGTDARVDELERELAEARQDAEELLAENERLTEEIRLLTSDDPDDTPPDDGSDDDGPDDDGPDPDEPTASAPGQPQPERSAEGLNEQLRTLFDLGGGPDGTWEPGTTGWSSAQAPDGLQDSYDSPGALAFDLAAALDAGTLGTDSWETTTRVLLDDDDPDQAYVAVLSWGWADDAVAGRDLRMTITGADGTWSPGGAEERFHCRRGVTDDDLCV